MNEAYLLIGGNMGDREGYLSRARELIEKHCGAIARKSSIYETAAWGLEEQDSFLNQVLQIKTGLKADKLLQQILHIEETLGRTRESKYGPRIIDIDILLFNNDVVKSEGLSIPHPQMQNRRFVLIPLAEIAKDRVHPVFHKTIAELLEKCTDNLPVQKIT